MSDLPTPLTPPDCDLRGLPFMPLDVVRLLDSDLFALTTGDEFKAAVALWCKSWTQIPAGSLPNDDRVLAHLSSAGVRWKKLKAGAMRGWKLCADGRWYHPVVSEKALEALPMRQQFEDKKSADVARKQREREDRKALFELLRSHGAVPDWDMPTRQLREMAKSYQSLPVTPLVTVPVTPTVTDESQQVTAKTGTVKGQGQETLTTSVPNGTGAAAPPTAEEQLALVKKEIWGEGKALFASKDIPGEKAGKILGQLLNEYSADIVLDAVRAGVKAEPPDPTAYLKACCQRAAGERANVQKNSRHNGFDKTDYTEGVTEDGRIA